ncbi:MAG: ASKHA domain-containing protein [Candidatus Parvarchaeota archaeon]|nr:ASKHA domain-containing protein [Candidatus Jingweiarchaeum tengchongense]
MSVSQRDDQMRRLRVNYTVRGKEIQKDLEVADGSNLFESLISNGIYVPNTCGGRHICGKCKVEVKKNQGIDKDEERFLTDTQKTAGIRLACFVKVDSDMEVRVPAEKESNILTEGMYSLRSMNSRIKKRSLTLSRPSLQDQRDDLKRITDEIGDVRVPLGVLREISSILENNDYKFKYVIRKGEIISVEPPNSDKVYGIAIDIGTTTIAAYLEDLSSGEKIDVYSDMNPQKIFGADVITRIDYTIKKTDGLDELQKAITGEMNKIVDEFCKRKGIEAKAIYEMVIVGNTTMMHLALGIPAKNIANAPFIPAFTSAIEIKAEEIGVRINPQGYIVSLPSVASYIGADIVADILSSRMYEKEEISLLLDIGTNGEIVLGNKDKLIACSAAAGPAFEGAEITFGTGGVIGAIDHVDLTKHPIYTTIGNERPSGICGSGIVDAIAEMIKFGIIDATGRILSKDEISLDGDILNRFIQYKGEPAFLVDDNGICITQGDVRQIQLAKGAIYAGIKVLMKEVGIEFEDIKRVYIAGGFGNYIDPESASQIGLIPKQLTGKVIQIGNAAGAGAIMALISDDEFKRAIEIAKLVEYVELSNTNEFQEEFMNGMYF